jgi:hypothetical protein
MRNSQDISIAENMRKHEQTGRPLGSENFVIKLEKILDRLLRPKKAGPKIKRKFFHHFFYYDFTSYACI